MAGKSDQKDDEKVEERRDAGIARMLRTPPKPHKDMKKGKAKEAEATQQASAKRPKKTD